MNWKSIQVVLFQLRVKGLLKPTQLLKDRQGSSWTVPQSITTHLQSHLRENTVIESAINLWSIFLGKMSREIKTCMRTTCKLHTERTQPGFEPEPSRYKVCELLFTKIQLVLQNKIGQTQELCQAFYFKIFHNFINPP